MAILSESWDQIAEVSLWPLTVRSETAWLSCRFGQVLGADLWAGVLSCCLDCLGNTGGQPRAINGQPWAIQDTRPPRQPWQLRSHIGTGIAHVLHFISLVSDIRLVLLFDCTRTHTYIVQRWCCIDAALAVIITLLLLSR